MEYQRESGRSGLADLTAGAGAVWTGKNAPKAEPTSSILESIAQRIRCASIAAGTISTNIENLGDRAFGPLATLAGGTGKDDVAPYSQVDQAFAALDELDAVIKDLERVSNRILGLA